MHGNINYSPPLAGSQCMSMRSGLEGVNFMPLQNPFVYCLFILLLLLPGCENNFADDGISPDKVTTVSIYDDSDKLNYYYTYDYNNDGNVSRWSVYSADNNLTSHY